MNYRIVCCAGCDGEGRIYESAYQHSTWDEPGGWGERDTGPCPYCEGTGGEIIETQPITLADLDAA